MSSYVSKKGVKQRINSPPPTEIYLKEIGFISQFVMSDIQSIQVCSGLEQNRRHFLRSPCKSGYSQSRSNFPSLRKSLYQELPSAETIDRSSYRFRKYSVFNTDLQMQFITTYHIFGMGYTTPWSFPG